MGLSIQNLSKISAPLLLLDSFIQIHFSAYYTVQLPMLSIAFKLCRGEQNSPFFFTVSGCLSQQSNHKIIWPFLAITHNIITQRAYQNNSDEAHNMGLFKYNYQSPLETSFKCFFMAPCYVGYSILTFRKLAALF